MLSDHLFTRLKLKETVAPGSPLTLLEFEVVSNNKPYLTLTWVVKLRSSSALGSF